MKLSATELSPQSPTRLIAADDAPGVELCSIEFAGVLATPIRVKDHAFVARPTRVISLDTGFPVALVYADTDVLLAHPPKRGGEDVGRMVQATGVSHREVAL